MGTPAKKRKLNSENKTSPPASRNLDYFFGKQRQNAPVKPANEAGQILDKRGDLTALTDEELARKLQAKWDQETAAQRAMPHVSASSAKSQSSSPTKFLFGSNNVAVAGTEELGGSPPKLKFEADIGAVAEVPNGEGDKAATDGTNGSAPIFGIPSPKSKGKNTLTLQSTDTAEDIVTSNIPFDESPLTFDPSKYVKDLQGHWASEGGDALYALLTRCFVLVNSTQSRIKIVDTLVNLLRVLIEGDPSSLLPTVRTNTMFFTYSKENLNFRVSVIFSVLVYRCSYLCPTEYAP